MTHKLETGSGKSDDGALKFEFTWYPGPGGKKIRQGAFKAFYQSGKLASEGNYVEGKEDGAWKNFHENGKLASAGTYVQGKEHGVWKYYGLGGKLEETVEYENGAELGAKPKKVK